jgi:hypothetical protein
MRRASPTPTLHAGRFVKYDSGADSSVMATTLESSRSKRKTSRSSTVDALVAAFTANHRETPARLALRKFVPLIPAHSVRRVRAT